MSIPLDDEERPLDILPAPLVDVSVEVVERDVRCGDEDVLDGGVEALEHGEVERPRALAVHLQVRRHLRPPAAVGHVPRRAAAGERGAGGGGDEATLRWRIA